MAESVVIPSQTTSAPPKEQSTLDLNNFSLPTISKPASQVPTNTPTIRQSTVDLSNYSLPIVVIPKPTVPPTNTTPQTVTKPVSQIPNAIPQTITKPVPQISFNLNEIKKEESIVSWKLQEKTPNNNALNLGSLNITTKSESKDDKQKTNALLASGVKEEPKKDENKPFLSNVQIIVGGYMIILGAILWSIWFQSYSNYISLQNQPQIDETKVSFVENGQNIELFLSKYTKINDFSIRADQTTLLTDNPEKESIVTTIKNDRNLNYTQKKVILQKNIDSLSSDIMQNNRTLEDTKLEIEKYGFIPKELYDMTQKQEGISNIRRTMLLTENMKFITAFKVFGYMESFIQWFANDSNIDVATIQTQLKELNENGEKDIITYTNNCYFNPYEIGDDCGITNDFDNYYKIINTKSAVNPDFIKKIASYADRKLQEKEIPNYTITFPEFNPKEQDISFTTDINTNRQDELALNKIGVVNPHLYIITNLINTLKQSLLVIGENIKVDQIKISPKTVRVWSTIFTINNSNLNFKLPIQGTDQREISDFFSTQSSN